MYTTFVSEEPLETIRYNECDGHPDLATKRFRRLFNEIETLREAVAAEREACAKIADEYDSQGNPAAYIAKDRIRQAIRKRGEG